MHALIALEFERTGKKSFYAGMKDIEPSTIDNGEHVYQNSDTTLEGSENLGPMLSVKEKQRVFQEEVLTLSAAFVEDVEK